MRNLILGLAFGLLMSSTAVAKMVEEKITYELKGTSFEGVLVYDESVKAKRPSVVMAPNWMGVTKAAIDKAKLLGGNKYVMFVADMYGVGIRPKNSKEAGAVSSTRPRQQRSDSASVNCLPGSDQQDSRYAITYT